MLLFIQTCRPFMLQRLLPVMALWLQPYSSHHISDTSAFLRCWQQKRYRITTNDFCSKTEKSRHLEWDLFICGHSKCLLLSSNRIEEKKATWGFCSYCWCIFSCAWLQYHRWISNSIRLLCNWLYNQWKYPITLNWADLYIHINMYMYEHVFDTWLT